ncbi:MAG TPA: hypothetical protein VOA87_19835 [Thermoanaerobaculia bacterium]|nr:hypothetical protein [Thermoanaerobaculia bacterium]
MDTEILTTATGLMSAIKATLEVARTVLAKGKGRTAEKAAEEALGLIVELQTGILQLQEKVFGLQEENSQLRAQVRQHQKGTADRERYELRNVGQSVVVVAKENPDVYLCATCFEAGAKVYLSKLGHSFRGMGTHSCPKCRGIIGAR